MTEKQSPPLNPDAKAAMLLFAKKNAVLLYGGAFQQVFNKPNEPMSAKREAFARLFAQNVVGATLYALEKSLTAHEHTLHSVFSSLVVRDVFVRQGPKGGYKGQITAFCEEDGALYSVWFLSKRAEAAALCAETPYQFLNEVAPLAYKIGGKKQRTYHAAHPTIGRVFVERISAVTPLDPNKVPYPPDIATHNTELLERRLAAWQGGDCPLDPVLSQNAQRSDVLEKKTSS